MQDVLELGVEARMNHPGTIGNGNWQWHLEPGEADDAAAERLRRATAESGRLLAARRPALVASA
jgi:4-alpha-glucanotransferase